MRKALATLVVLVAIPFSVGHAQTNGFLKRGEAAFNNLSPENQLVVRRAVINPQQIYIDENGRYVTGEYLLNKEVKPQETDAQLSQAMAKGKKAKEKYTR